MAEQGRELTREEKIAAARAKVEALKQQRAEGQTGAPAAGAGAALDLPVNAANVGGRPLDAGKTKQVRVYGTVNQAVEIVADPGDLENLKKLLVGISGYQNPLRGGAFQVDYRYYAEARRRLEQAGYAIEETDYMGRPLAGWSPQTRGWTRVEGT
jgi:hypothetical protein